MVRVLSGLNEPDDPNRPNPEIAIRITVPQEFAGWSMGEIIARRGFITGINGENENAVIQGRLPTSEYRGLADVLAEATQDSGKIEQDGLW